MKKQHKKVYMIEPIFFIVLGLFHIHRIWGIFDRAGYSNFWMDIFKEKGLLYFTSAIILGGLCIFGIAIFIKERKQNYWWRWIYIFGGSYLLFDLFSILIGFKWWESLILHMFDITNPYWNKVWGLFIVLGIFTLMIGIYVLRLYLRFSSEKRYLSGKSKAY